MRVDALALPLLLLSPFAAAGSSNHKSNNRRAHKRLAKTSPEQERDLEIRDANQHNATLAKRQSFNGRGTFYYTGLGACGQYSKDSDYMVALNSAQYGGGYPGPQCFKMITVQANGVTVGGVQIMDECPTCDFGGLDLSPGLFKRFADEGAGVIQVTWWFDGQAPAPAPSTTTTSQWVAPTSTWTPPTSTWQAPTSTWSPPPAPTTTWTPPSSSAWVAPSSSSTTTPPPSSSSSSSYVSSSSSASVNGTVNPFAVVSSYNGTSSSTSVSVSAASASASVSGAAGGAGGGGAQQAVQGNNLMAINGLVANYGQLIVVGAQGA